MPADFSQYLARSCIEEEISTILEGNEVCSYPEVDVGVQRLTVQSLGCVLKGSKGSAEEIAEPVEGLWVLRREQPRSFESHLYGPVLCLILQGRKDVAVGQRHLSFGPGECLLVSHHLPVSSQVATVPYLALVLDVDLAIIRTLYDDVALGAPGNARARAAEIYRADAALIDAFSRYIALADSPTDARVLGPLIRKEIHYRLLVAPYGGMLRNLVRLDSHASAIAQAIGHIRRDISAQITIPDLARAVGMSETSFYKHFKAVTSRTPLQYQKELRLLEARQRLRSGAVSVSTAAFDVGYESPSQFSREYARSFGVAPSRDVARAGR